MDKKRKVIIFDLDGTLLDTLTDITLAVNYAMEKNGFPKYTEEEVRPTVGRFNSLIEYAVPDGRDNPSFQACLDAYLEHYMSHLGENTSPYPGVMEMLDTLRSEGYTLAICSNKSVGEVEELRKCYFEDVVSAATGAPSREKRKPVPDMIFNLMKELGVTRDDCIYVGDTEIDIETAKNANIPSVGVGWGFRDEDVLKECGATATVANIAQLTECILAGTLN